MWFCLCHCQLSTVLYLSGSWWVNVQIVRIKGNSIDCQPKDGIFVQITQTIPMTIFCMPRIFLSNFSYQFFRQIHHLLVLASTVLANTEWLAVKTGGGSPIIHSPEKPINMDFQLWINHLWKYSIIPDTRFQYVKTFPKELFYTINILGSGNI